MKNGNEDKESPRAGKMKNGTGNDMDGSQSTAHVDGVPGRQVNSTQKASANSDSKHAPKVRTLGKITDRSQRHGPIIPDAIFEHGTSVIAVYAAVKKSLHRNSGDCHPGLDTICKKAGVERKTAEKAIRTIAGLGEWVVHMKAGCRTYYEFPDYPLTFTPWQKKKKQLDPGKRTQGSELSDTQPRQMNTGYPGKKSTGSTQLRTAPREKEHGYPGKKSTGTPVKRAPEPMSSNQCLLTNSPLTPQGENNEGEENKTNSNRTQPGAKGKELIVASDDGNPFTSLAASSFGETVTGEKLDTQDAGPTEAGDSHSHLPKSDPLKPPARGEQSVRKEAQAMPAQAPAPVMGKKTGLLKKAAKATTAELKDLHRKVSAVWVKYGKDDYWLPDLSWLSVLRSNGWEKQQIIDRVRREAGQHPNLKDRQLDNFLKRLAASGEKPPMSSSQYSPARYADYLDAAYQAGKLAYVIAPDSRQYEPSKNFIANRIDANSWAYQLYPHEEKWTRSQILTVADHMKNPQNPKQEQQLKQATDDFLAHNGGRKAEKEQRKYLPASVTMPDSRMNGLHGMGGSL